jgi:hypothetical protein
MPSLNKPASDRHFVGDPDQRLLCHVFAYSADLKANLPGPDSGDPKLRLALAFAHSRFQRLGTYRLMRKQPDIDFAFTMQKMSCCNSAGFNVPCGYPATHEVASRSIAFHFAALALTVLHSFRHHCHFLGPL